MEAALAHLPAFSPRFAAPPHPPLWSGEGVGAEMTVATPQGLVAAGRLQPGMAVIGPGGAETVLDSVRHLALPAAALRRLGLAAPVRVAAGALGQGLPAQDLVLGPAQCLLLDGAWVPGFLLAGLPRVQLLEQGAALVLLRGAGGMMVSGATLAPAGTRPSGGEALVPAMLRLGGVAGALGGFVEHADRRGVAGWAVDPAARDRVVAVEAVCDGVVLARGLADRPRPDLVESGAGGRLGRHGFALRFARPLAPGRAWMLTVRGAEGGATLRGCPALVDALAPDPARFDAALAGLPADAASVEFLAGLIRTVLSKEAVLF
jgi:hypothetical protein